LCEHPQEEVTPVELEEQISGYVRSHPDRGLRYPQIATAESATAGRIADTLTRVPGASDYVVGGVVAYSNAAKERLLKVKHATLEAHGAVSEEVAREMAEGGRIALAADVCVADTGIAGPGGGSEAKPVGLFFLAVSSRSACVVRRFVFQGDRESNKNSAVRAALTMLRDYLLESDE
jgi:PncC family amidohydrolase